LLGINENPDVQSQKERLEKVLVKEGVTVFVESLPLNIVYRDRLNDDGEKARIEKIEIFDEFEEWELLMSHYCLTLGVAYTCPGAANIKI